MQSLKYDLRFTGFPRLSTNRNRRSNASVCWYCSAGGSLLGDGFNADFKGVESVEPDGVLEDDVELNDELAKPDVDDEPLRPPLPLLLGPRDIAESVDENSEIVCVEGEERKETERFAGWFDVEGEPDEPPRAVDDEEEEAMMATTGRERGRKMRRTGSAGCGVGSAREVRAVQQEQASSQMWVQAIGREVVG